MKFDWQGLLLLLFVLALPAALVIAVYLGAQHNKRLDQECIDRGGRPVHTRDLWMCVDPKVFK